MVYVVCGMPASGKSTYIKNHLRNKDIKIIDVFVLQKEYSVYVAHYMVLELLKKELKKDPHRDIVIENTLLKKKRRKEILDITEKYDCETTLIFCDASDSTIIERYGQRYSDASRDIDAITKHISDYREIQEKPNNNEGFDNIIFNKEY